LDTSAGAIAACGLLLLAELLRETEGDFYFEGALKILQTLEERYCDWNPARDSIVQKGSVQYHGSEAASGKPGEIHVPLIYGDYFFIEGIYRLLNPEFRMW
jgi:unsaturated chondroitin disaccharide hydrolase